MEIRVVRKGEIGSFPVYSASKNNVIPSGWGMREAEEDGILVLSAFTDGAFYSRSDLEKKGIKIELVDEP